MFVTITTQNKKHSFTAVTPLIDYIIINIWGGNPDAIPTREMHQEIRAIITWLDKAHDGDEYDDDKFTLTYAETPTYKIGQILVTDKDTVVEKALSCDQITIEKGTKIIIGPDKFAHHMQSNLLQPLPKNAVVKDYDTHGLADLLYERLCNRFEIEALLESYEDSPEDFKEIIANALDDIGF